MRHDHDVGREISDCAQRPLAARLDVCGDQDRRPLRRYAQNTGAIVAPRGKVAGRMQNREGYFVPDPGLPALTALTGNGRDVGSDQRDDIGQRAKNRRGAARVVGVGVTDDQPIERAPPARCERRKYDLRRRCRSRREISAPRRIVGDARESRSAHR